MTDLQQAIDYALSYAQPGDVIDGVKSAVANELAAVSRAFTIKQTNHFNHSLYPDLVAWWGRRDDERREVFLRFDVAQSHIAADIVRLAPDQPLFFSLKPRSLADLDPSVSEAIAEQPTALVTSTAGVAPITETPPETMASMVAEAVIQHGRGYLDEAIASNARDAATQGIQAAVSGDIEATRRMISVARDLLGRNAPRIEQYLQVLWMTGGHPIDEFPGDRSLALDIDGTDIASLLRIILKGPVVADLEFWERLASRTNLSTLETLGVIEPSRNLQSLIAAAVRSLTVSYAAVDEHAPRMTPLGPFRWQLGGETLSLDLPEAALSFTDDGRHFRSRKSGSGLLDAATLRARSQGFHVERVGLDEEEVVITVEQKPENDRAGIVLDRLPDTGRSRVRDTTVTVEGKSFTCSFDRGIGGLQEGHAALAAVAYAAGSLLVGLTGEDRERLRTFLLGEPTTRLDPS